MGGVVGGMGIMGVVGGMGIMGVDAFYRICRRYGVEIKRAGERGAQPSVMVRQENAVSDVSKAVSAVVASSFK